MKLCRSCLISLQVVRVPASVDVAARLSCITPSPLPRHPTVLPSPCPRQAHTRDHDSITDVAARRYSTIS